MEFAKDQVRNAMIMAMDRGRAFSWVKTRDVQKGVYLKYSQSFFQTYEMSKSK